MKTGKYFVLSLLACALVATVLLSGCQTTKTAEEACCPPDEVKPTVAPASTGASISPVTREDAQVSPPVRIKAGPGVKFTDAEGNQWVTDRGFLDGDTIERPGIAIANTKTPVIYQSERYSMSAFSYPVPNGKYLVKLHFAETYDELQGAGDRVFSFNVEGKAFNDFDVAAKAGGVSRAYIETVPVEVTDGKVDITFTAKVQNPQINGIEILPAP